MTKSTLKEAFEEIKTIFKFSVDRSKENHYIVIGDSKPAPLGWCPALTKCLEEPESIDFNMKQNCDGKGRIALYNDEGEIQEHYPCWGCDNCGDSRDDYAYLKEWKHALKKAGVKTHYGPRPTSSSCNPILWIDDDDIGGYAIQPDFDDSQCSGFREAVTKFVFGEYACYVPYCAGYVEHLSWTYPRGWALMVIKDGSKWPTVIGRGKTKIETLLNALKSL